MGTTNQGPGTWTGCSTATATGTSNPGWAQWSYGNSFQPFGLGTNPTNTAWVFYGNCDPEHGGTCDEGSANAESPMSALGNQYSTHSSDADPDGRHGSFPSVPILGESTCVTSSNELGCLIGQVTTRVADQTQGLSSTEISAIEDYALNQTIATYPTSISQSTSAETFGNVVQITGNTIDLDAPLSAGQPTAWSLLLPSSLNDQIAQGPSLITRSGSSPQPNIVELRFRCSTAPPRSQPPTTC